MTRVSAISLFCLLLSSAAVADPARRGDHDARWVVPHGKGTRDIKAVLSVEDNAIVLLARNGDVLRELPYDSLTTISHSTTRSRRWVSGLVTGTVINPLGFGFLFLKSKKHYVTFYQDDRATVVRLNGDAYANVLASLARRTSRPLVQAAQ
jgi:hypothetical protein